MTIDLDRREVLLAGLAGAAAVSLPGRALAATGKLPADITDGQVHIWQPGGEKKPSPSGRQEPFSAEELLAVLDENGVNRAVIVPPSWAVRGNSYALESAVKYPERLRVLGLISMVGEDKRPEVEAWLDQPGMAGMRMFLSHKPGAEWLAGGGADWLWPVLAEKQIPISIHAGDSLPVLAAAAGKYPDLKLCLDAFGLGRGVEASEALGKFQVVADTMAEYPNVSVKTGAIPRDSGQPFPFPNMQEVVKVACDRFGTDRLFYASDITLLKGPYSEGLDFWTELDFLTDDERAQILGGNMNAWLGWA